MCHRVDRVFLSTLSLRRATINSRADNVKRHKISIHALLAESDASSQQEKNNGHEFLSTLSLRRATSPASITPAASRNFYPRSPCGERQTVPGSGHINKAFLSTLSLRRATANRCTTEPDFRYFYPRSPCGERHCHLIPNNGTFHFYPRSPCGERPSTQCRL